MKWGGILDMENYKFVEEWGGYFQTVVQWGANQVICNILKLRGGKKVG